MHLETITLTFAGIMALSAVCQWVAWRVKLPAILFLLMAGIFVGPVFGLLHPVELFGDLLQPMVSLAVAIILFEGSLTLKFGELNEHRSVVRRLVSIGMVINWLIITCFFHLLKFPWGMAFLMGALIVVTGPTVIVPILRTVRPNNKISSVLRWEGILIDPIGALLAVLVYQFLVSTGQSQIFGTTVLLFLEIVLTGAALGLGGALALGWMLKRLLIPEYLNNLCSLAVVLGVFTISNYFAEESGLLAVTVMGITLTNLRNIHIDEILSFKEHLSVLLISVLFILLAARIDLGQMKTLLLPGFLVLGVVHFVARPISVFFSTIGSSLSWREKFMISWIGPRGIVAAAVSALFALRLEEKGVQYANLLVPFTFFIIIGTVVLQSATAGWLARLLGVAEPEPKGFLVVGGNDVSRVIAHALQQLGFRTLLTSTNWSMIRQARMEGLETFYGHPISEKADYTLDFVGIGHLLALSPDDEINTVSSMRYQSEFGRENIYSLPVSKENNDRSQGSRKHKGYTLFSNELSFRKFQSLLKQGARIRTTTLTETFSFEDLRKDSGIIPLFGLSRSKKLFVFTVERPVEPKAGWTVISLDYNSPKEKDRRSEEESLKTTEAD